MTSDASFSVEFVHRLRFVRDVFDPKCSVLCDLMPSASASPARALVLVDGGLVQNRPEVISRVSTYFAQHAERLAFASDPQVVRGGESAKNDPMVLEEVLAAIHEARLCRQSYVVAVGGGAMLDVVGFAAATAHRGVRLVRLPTTTLSQADSGLGVKNGINLFGKKNFLGTFSPPWAVVNDGDFLTSLSAADWRCGFAEAVKVGLVKDGALFEEIEREAEAIVSRVEEPAQRVIRQSAELHQRHIVEGGDPFELTHARPLDFGHWSAHKLEQLSGFSLRHGEAVAIGVALDAIYSAKAGCLEGDAANRICACLAALGFELFHDSLQDVDALIEGLEEFREHLGGPLTITLLSGIGQAIDVHEMDADVLRGAVNDLAILAERFADAPTPTS